MADIGATTTRCALLDDKGQELAPEIFENADFTGVAGVLSVYLDHRRASDRPTRAALAVAAPITGDEVQMINIDWRFSQSALKETLRLKRLAGRQRLRGDRVGDAAADTRGRRANRRRRERAAHDACRARPRFGARRLGARTRGRRLGLDGRRRRPCIDAGRHARGAGGHRSYCATVSTGTARRSACCPAPGS